MTFNIIVGGGFTYVPFSPGAAWTRLELALGLIKLGHNVLIVEEVSDDWCYDKSGLPARYENSWSRSLFIDMMTRFGVLDHACQIYNAGEATAGLPLHTVIRFAGGTDILINNSGHITLESIIGAAKRRALI